MAAPLLGESGYGWLRPDGSILPTPFHGHLAQLADDRDAPPGMAEWIVAIKALSEQEGADSVEFSASIGEDEHPCWHAYSSLAGDEASRQRALMVDLLHQRDWIRLGTREDRHRRRRMLDAQGCLSTLERRKTELEALVDRMELDALKADAILSCTPERETALAHDEVRSLVPAFYDEALESFRASKSYKGGTKERQVAFTCRWNMRIDSFPERLMPLHAPGLLRHSIHASAPRWQFYHHAVSEAEVRTGYSDSKFPCPPPSSIVSQAVADPDYRLRVPSAKELQEMLRRCGCDTEAHLLPDPW